MNKKYQFFISSTYEDLKEERQAAIQAVLTLNQFPVGMEMFSAADEEQWGIITEAIDSSDYYILIIGNSYGTIIDDGSDKGISYTEKEYNYAAEKKIPVLAFLIDKSLEQFSSAIMKDEKEKAKLEKLVLFKDKVKDSHHTVKFWHSADNLEAEISQSISKAIARGKRPGWIRTTDFDVDKSLAEITRLTERVHMLEGQLSDLRMKDSRKPELYIECLKDYDMDGNEIDDDSEAEITDDGVIHFHVSKVDVSDVIDSDGQVVYKNEIAEECVATYDEVRLFRYLCKNSHAIIYRICNTGNLKATDVRVRMEFPNNLMTISARELNEFLCPQMGYAQGAYENRNRLFWEPRVKSNKGEKEVAEDGTEKVAEQESTQTENDKFVSIDELITSDDISNLLDPADFNEVVSIFPGEISAEFPDVKHHDSEVIRGAYILPLAAGTYEIRCSILCNESPDEITQMIRIVVD